MNVDTWLWYAPMPGMYVVRSTMGCNDASQGIKGFIIVLVSSYMHKKESESSSEVEQFITNITK